MTPAMNPGTTNAYDAYEIAASAFSKFQMISRGFRRIQLDIESSREVSRGFMSFEGLHDSFISAFPSMPLLNRYQTPLRPLEFLAETALKAPEMLLELPETVLNPLVFC